MSLGDTAPGNSGSRPYFTTRLALVKGVPGRTGGVTSAFVTWVCNNTWSVSTGTPADANARLMNGYLDTHTTSTTTVTLSNVPYPVYDVVVYFDGDGNGRSGAYRVTDGAADVLKSPLLDNWNWPITTGGGIFTLADSGQAGDYAYFRRFTNPSATITATTRGIDFRAPLNAVQIVQISEPGTLTLLALGGVGLLIRRRRKR